MRLWGGPKIRRATSPPPPRKRPSRRRASRDDERRDRSRDRARNRSPSLAPRRKSDSYQSSSPSPRSRRRIYADPAMNRSAPFSESRSSLPYPKFSKEHSREALGRENVALNDRTPLTPDSTRVDTRASPSPMRDPLTSWKKQDAPPSPPSTAAGSGELNPVQSRRKEKRRKDDGSPGKHIRFSASRTSLRFAEEGRSSSGTSPRSSLQKPRAATPVGGNSPLKSQPENAKQSQAGPVGMPSDVQSTLPLRKESDKAPTIPSQRGPSPSTVSEQESQPRTPPLQYDDTPIVDVPGSRKETPIIEVFASHGSLSDLDDEGTIEPGSSHPAAPPPPPPPPGIAQHDIPRVDYLLQNGGLPKQIPRNFSSALRPPPPHSYQQYAPSQTAVSRSADMHQMLAPYQELLEKFEQVIRRNGSIAVATGYKSVARRILDRLEVVFSRNISSELCGCVMCNLERSSYTYDGDKDTGVSWGEVLELVSGRRDSPQWPPFSLPTTSNGLALKDLEHEVPMQKLDIDVPEEYREHYIRQSKKTKQSVDKWLASQPEDQASPPTEVDDETLTFAMLTYLEPHQKRIFTALIRGLPEIPDPRSPTPKPREGDAAPATNSTIMPKVATAIQRLYRLAKLPRDPECAMFLLKNPSIHSALATLAAISIDEWDILVSGRFDGFLVSGAENRFPSMGPVPPRGTTPFSKAQAQAISRGPTPFRSTPSRGPNMTPHQNGSTGTQSPITPGPVQMDEDTEIAVLAEVEREIYLGMDALEDALEALHVKAETVRKSLRERSAGLSLQAQSRKSVGEELRAVMGTPFMGVDENDESCSGYGTPTRGPGTPGKGVGVHGLWDVDDGLMDDAASLAPDDSASNIGWKERSKHRHRKRRPRRMAEPVEEERSE